MDTFNAPASLRREHGLVTSFDLRRGCYRLIGGRSARSSHVRAVLQSLEAATGRLERACEELQRGRELAVDLGITAAGARRNGISRSIRCSRGGRSGSSAIDEYHAEFDAAMRCEGDLPGARDRLR